MVRVWEVSGPYVSDEYDSLIFDNEDAAGAVAVHAAELAWGETPRPREKGAAVSVRCYEISWEEWQEISRGDDDG